MKENLESISIDFVFQKNRPSFGDLFKIVGFENPNFISESDLFLNFTDLNIEQVDDYFGIRNTESVGDDVALWVFPLVSNEEVFHHEGPFDGVRLYYNILTNPIINISVLESTFKSFQKHLAVSVIYKLQKIDSFFLIKEDIDSGIKYWKGKGITPGSEDALMLRDSNE